MASDLNKLLYSSARLFGHVVAFNPQSDRLLWMDLSAANRELSPEVFGDWHRFSEYITTRLGRYQAKYGIGGYAEYRDVYSASSVFDSDDSNPEPRRLHLGIDIWGRPNTGVMAPYDGLVHSFGYHDEPGNYGGTIILTHQLDGKSFYTLYGHLSLNSIRNLRTGLHIGKGDYFAEFGIPAENGQWPPHLHFQVIDDLGSWNGDYPGVCRQSESAYYLENCPDPDRVLQLAQFAIRP